MVSSIHDYIERDDDSQIKHWLNNCLDINEPDEKKRTPLFVAVQKNNIATAKIIIKKGCNLNQPDQTGTTPLHLAIETKKYKMADLLLTSKADPNRKNPNESTPTHLLCSTPPNPQQPKILESIIKNGGKLNSTNACGDTPIHTACLTGNLELIQLLLKNGASPDQQNLAGETPLHCSVSSGDASVLKEIVKVCSRLYTKTKEGNTALDLARAYHPSLVSIIEEAKFQKIPWKEVKPSGKWPIPRCNHSASVYNNRWYIYGGQNDFNNPTMVYDDMHFYNGDANEWRLLAPRATHRSEPTPTGLTKHTSLIFGSKLYLFGGTSLEKTFNDLWVLDLDQMVWFYEKPESAYLIRPRAGHTMTKISDTKFCVIGGSSGSDFFNDIHVYDIQTKIWERIDIPNPASAPSKRHLHSATYSGGNLYLFGGCDNEKSFHDIMMLEIETWNWFELDIRGTIPMPRSGHSGIIVNNSILLIYGGVDNDKEILADIKSFDLNTYTWIKYDSTSSNTKQALHRAGHTVTLINNSIYAYGGNSVFCMHELLPHILDNQALPIPENVEAEKKVVFKPPIPEKPSIDASGSPSYKVSPEKLEIFVKELMALIKEQKPSLDSNHPIMIKCKEIETFLSDEPVDKPQLPSKPALPAKPTITSSPVPVDSPNSLSKRRRPPSMQVNMPSVVMAELEKNITPKSTPPIPRKAPSSPLEGKKLPNRPPKGLPPKVPARDSPPPTRPRGTPGSPRGLPRGTTVGTNIRGRGGRGLNKVLPNPPTRMNRAQSAAPARESGSNFDPLHKIGSEGTTVSALCLQAPQKQMGSLPSLMLKDPEEEQVPVSQEDVIHKLAHTQPTQYKLPPPPSNPLQHYQQLMDQKPTRNKVIISDFKDKKEKTLYEIINEVLTTEEGYIRDLAVLIGMFKKPLENEYLGCIPPHYLEIIFGNAEDLFTLHITLFKELLQAETKSQGVGIAFMKVINLFPQYNSYCTNQINSTETVQKLLKTNASFVEFTKLMEAMAECNRQDIQSYLIKPFQRVTRYPLLLKELLKQTSRNSKDYQHLSDSIVRIDAIVKDANEEKRRNDTLVKMIEIQQSFIDQGDEGQLKFSPDCKFVLESKFKEFETKTQKTVKRHFFLFSDMVVIAKEVGKKYKKQETIPLDSCIIWDIKQGSSEIPKNIKYAFSIVRTDKTMTDSGKLIMCAKTSTDKELWINSINSAIASYMTPTNK